MKRPLVVIGGIVSNTLLTLLVLHVLFSLARKSCPMNTDMEGGD